MRSMVLPILIYMLGGLFCNAAFAAPVSTVSVAVKDCTNKRKAVNVATGLVVKNPNAAHLQAYLEAQNKWEQAGCLLSTLHQGEPS